ncbi:NAD-dependent epimerase/dehydratase family protein [Actinomycetes bacterium NPDC127524]
MEKALVLGGTRFFGKHLVNALLEKGVDVTVATRGKNEIPFGDKVKTISFDRNEESSFFSAFKDGKWDVVFDQICYTAKDAREAINVFAGKTEQYIFTSSMSVYEFSEDMLSEGDFDPYHYTIPQKTHDVSYGEGKRLSESVFCQDAPFKTVCVRFPIVQGMNDYTNRLTFHIDRIEAGKEIYFSNPEAAISFITEEEAGGFLCWAANAGIEGPINAASNGLLTLREMLGLIENETGKSFILANEKNQDNESPYNLPVTWVMSNKKAKELGFEFTDVNEWLPRLIHEVHRK